MTGYIVVLIGIVCMTGSSTAQGFSDFAFNSPGQYISKDGLGEPCNITIPFLFTHITFNGTCVADSQACINSTGIPIGRCNNNAGICCQNATVLPALPAFTSTTPSSASGPTGSTTAQTLIPGFPGFPGFPFPKSATHGIYNADKKLRFPRSRFQRSVKNPDLKQFPGIIPGINIPNEEIIQSIVNTTIVPPAFNFTVPPFLSNFTLPNITLPNVTLPAIPTLPSVTLPNVTFPDVTLPVTPTLPNVTLPDVTPPVTPTIPSITVPTVTLPAVTLPVTPTLPSITLPTVTLPGVTLPVTPTLPSITLPTVTLPDVTLPVTPTLPSITLPTVTLPDVTLPVTPTLPSITVPTVTLPAVTLPVTPTLPSVTLPTVTLPAVTLPSTTTPPPAQNPPAEPADDSPSAPSSSQGDPSAEVTPSPADSVETAEDTSVSDGQQTVPVCRVVTTGMSSVFKNPSYPFPDKAPNICEYVVVPRNGTCALRYEFDEAIFAGRLGDSCYTDSIQIINSNDRPTAPQCGLLSGYQITVKTGTAPVSLLITTQSEATIWKIKATQILCSSIKSVKDLEPEYCGRKGFHNSPGVAPTVETVKTIPVSKLLKSKSNHLKSVYETLSVPDNLLENQLLRKSSSEGLRIVRGNETGVNEYPWQAFLMVGGRPLCGGSLINHEWLITAGHCASLSLRYPLASVIVVDLGDHDLRANKDSRNKIYQVSRIVPHVQHQAVFNDIALLKLSSKVEFTNAISPVCLPHSDFPESEYIGRNAITTGWGKTEDSIISPVLRQAEVKIMSNEDCRSSWELVGEGGGEIVDDKMICAGGGEVGPCNGDSGGPLIVQDKEDTNKWNLVGITSFGSLKGCALPGVPTVFTRVTSFLEWIAMNLAEP